MKNFFTLFLALILFFLPGSVQSEDFDTLPITIESQEAAIEDNEVQEKIVVPQPMSNQEIDDLFGPEPYLGPTSWLGSKNEK